MDNNTWTFLSSSLNNLNWTCMVRWTDYTALQMQALNCEPCRFEDEHATSRSRRLQTALNWRKKVFFRWTWIPQRGRNPPGPVRHASIDNHCTRAPLCIKYVIPQTNFTYLLPWLNTPSIIRIYVYSGMQRIKQRGCRARVSFQGFHSPGKPGIWPKKNPCMEKSWNFLKGLFSWKNHGILFQLSTFFSISE